MAPEFTFGNWNDAVACNLILPEKVRYYNYANYKTLGTVVEEFIAFLFEKKCFELMTEVALVLKAFGVISFHEKCDH